MAAKSRARRPRLDGGERGGENMSAAAIRGVRRAELNACLATGLASHRFAAKAAAHIGDTEKMAEQVYVQKTAAQNLAGIDASTATIERARVKPITREAPCGVQGRATGGHCRQLYLRPPEPKPRVGCLLSIRTGRCSHCAGLNPAAPVAESLPAA